MCKNNEVLYDNSEYDRFFIKHYSETPDTSAFVEAFYQSESDPLLRIPTDWRRFFSLYFWRVKLFTKWEYAYHEALAHKQNNKLIEPQEIEIVHHRRGLADLTGRRGGPDA